ncbi:hypothetical protein BU17DRAFT_62983 [Hysterangium stoloniferum]|nr:hypothetical protein BU17DRAFT_62983 [Hysterangium stoloniferum]
MLITNHRKAGGPVTISHFAVVSNILQSTKFQIPDFSSTSQHYRVGDVIVGGKSVLPFFRALHTPPLNMGSSQIKIYRCLRTGRKSGWVFIFVIVLCPKTNTFEVTLVVISKFNHEDMLKSIVDYRIKHLLYRFFHALNHSATKNYDLAYVRSVLVDGAPFSANLMKQFPELLPWVEIVLVYGTTEMPTVVAMVDFASYYGIRRKIHLNVFTPDTPETEDSNLAGLEEPGELVVTSPQIVSGARLSTCLLGLRRLLLMALTAYTSWVYTGDSVVTRENGDIFINYMNLNIVAIGKYLNGEMPMAFVTLKADDSPLVADDPEAANKIKESLKKFVSNAKSQYKWLAGEVYLL